MVDATRALLDELMGEDRNLGAEERQKPKPKRHFSDRDICKPFLCGFCPETEYERTKYELGSCQSIHDDKCKQEWDALDEAGKAKYSYQKELKRRLDGIMADLNKKLQRNSERLAAQEAPAVTASDQEALNLLAQRIADLLAQSEALGEAGDVDGAQALVAQADTLKAQRAALEHAATTVAAKSAGAAQMVCPFSGVIINVDEARQRDHKSGRNYHTWVKAHAVYKELKELLAKRELSHGPGPVSSERPHGDELRSSSREGYSSRDRDRDRRDAHGRDGRDHHRDRDRERGRDKDSRDRHSDLNARDRRDHERSNSRRERSRDRSPGGRSRHTDPYRRRERDR